MWGVYYREKLIVRCLLICCMAICKVPTSDCLLHRGSEELRVSRVAGRVGGEEAFTVVSRPSTNGAALARGFLLCKKTVGRTKSIGKGTATGRTISS